MNAAVISNASDSPVASIQWTSPANCSLLAVTEGFRVVTQLQNSPE